LLRHEHGANNAACTPLQKPIDVCDVNSFFPFCSALACERLAPDGRRIGVELLAERRQVDAARLSLDTPVRLERPAPLSLVRLQASMPRMC